MGYINSKRPGLNSYEFAWLLKILTNRKNTWQQHVVASRFVKNTLLKQRKATASQLYVLKYRMSQPYKKILENELFGRFNSI